MEGYSSILLAVDFHDDCHAVTGRAMELVHRYGARLDLLHVVESMPVEPGNELMIPPTASVEGELLETAERRVKRLAQELGVPESQCQVRVGQTKREILAAAAELSTDLIVVGSHGRHGLALLLGSTANAILHGAQCDVLAVRI